MCIVCNSNKIPILYEVSIKLCQLYPSASALKQQQKAFSCLKNEQKSRMVFFCRYFELDKKELQKKLVLLTHLKLNSFLIKI